MFSRLFISIIAFFLSALTVKAADLEWIDADRAHSAAIFFDGEIADGDLQKLTYLVERNHRKPDLFIVFDSNGGDIHEAIKIGKYIRDKKFSTAIVSGYGCYSVCFFSFIGGKTKVILPTGRLGVHSFYSKGGISEATLRAYTESMGVSPETINIAARTSPHDVHVFSQAELERFSLISVKNQQETTPSTTQSADSIFWQQDDWTVKQGAYGGNYCAMHNTRLSSTANGMLWFSVDKGSHLTTMSYINEPEILAKIVKENKNMMKSGDKNLVKIILLLDDQDPKHLLADYVGADETIEDSVPSFDMTLKPEDRADISHQEMLLIFTEETLIDMVLMTGAEAAFEALDKCHAAL